MIVAGVGLRKAASLRSLAQALETAEALAGARASALATVAAKAGSAQIVRLAKARGVPLLAVDVAGVETQTRSARVMVAFGTGSVAEAAALVGAGPGARLLLARIVSEDGAATVALAEGI